MAENITLNQARLRLGIGKEKLRRLLLEMGIEPVQINKQRKEISSKDLDLLNEFLASSTADQKLVSSRPVHQSSPPVKSTTRPVKSTSQLQSTDFQATIELALLKEKLDSAQREISQLTNQLQSTEKKLEIQQEESKEERLAERKEREGYQMLMMKLQQDNQQLQQKLLEAPTIYQQSTSRPVDSTEWSSASPLNDKGKFSGGWFSRIFAQP